jgi:hypothetical protein
VEAAAEITIKTATSAVMASEEKLRDLFFWFTQ